MISNPSSTSSVNRVSPQSLQQRRQTTPGQVPERFDAMENAEQVLGPMGDRLLDEDHLLLPPKKRLRYSAPVAVDNTPTPGEELTRHETPQQQTTQFPQTHIRFLLNDSASDVPMENPFRLQKPAIQSILMPTPVSAESAIVGPEPMDTVRPQSKRSVHDPLALVRAIRRREFNRVKDMLTAELDPDAVNAVDEHGKTPLLWAAQLGRSDVGLSLLKQGANSDVQDKGKITPLMWTTVSGTHTLFNALLPLEKDINARDEKQKTALMWAAAHKRPLMVKALLDAGADATLTDYKGFNAISYAINSGNKDCLGILLKTAYSQNPLNQTVTALADWIQRLQKQVQQQTSK